jgi:hypothetical protein
MIKPGIILALLLLCVALLSAVYLIKGDRPRADALLKVGGHLVDGIEAPDINSISIKKSSTEINLQRAARGWTLASHKNRPVAEERMKELIAMILQTVVIDTREADDKDFELDAENRTEITINTPAGKKQIYVGASIDGLANGAPARSFARTSTTGPVYEIDSALDLAAGIVTENDKRVLDPRRFYDLKIMKVNSQEVIDIAIKKAHQLVRVQRVIPGKGTVPVGYTTQEGDAKPVWWITEPQGYPAEPIAVSQVLTQVMDLDAKAYADGVSLEQAGLAEPSAKIRIVMRNGAEHIFTFGKITGDQVYLKINNNENIFVVYRYRFDSMAIGFDDLKLKDAVGSEPEALPRPKEIVPAKVDPQPRKSPVAPPPPPPEGKKVDPKPVDTIIIPDAQKK